MSKLQNYFTNASVSGTVQDGQLPRSIPILEAPDNPAPIGLASEIGRTEDGAAARSLRIRSADVPGLWIIIAGRFVAI